MAEHICKLLIGIPASGKSTYINQKFHTFDDGGVLCAYDQKRRVNFSVFSTDNIIEEMAREAGQTYDEVFQDASGIANKIFCNQLKKAKNWDVIIDRTNLSVKSRKRFFDIFKDHKFEAVVFPFPEKEEWERRLNSRPGKTIPQSVLNSMIESYQIPTVNEGFSEIHFYEGNNA